MKYPHRDRKRNNIILKLLKTNYKEKILRKYKEERYTIYRKIRIMADFMSKAMQDRKQWNGYAQY